MPSKHSASAVYVWISSDFPRSCLTSSPWWNSYSLSLEHKSSGIPREDVTRGEIPCACTGAGKSSLPFRVQSAAVCLLRNPATSVWCVCVVIMNLGLFSLRYTVKLGENTLSLSGCYRTCKKEIEEKKCCPGFWGTECYGKFFIHL